MKNEMQCNKVVVNVVVVDRNDRVDGKRKDSNGEGAKVIALSGHAQPGRRRNVRFLSFSLHSVLLFHHY